MPERLSETQEELLEAVWTTIEGGRHDLAAVRAVCPIPVTPDDLERLHATGCLVSAGDTVLLTDLGERWGARIVRRHRLAATLLCTVLRLRHAEAAVLACQAEHTLLPEVEEAICTLLGHPRVCPDGRPVPSGVCCQQGACVVTHVVRSVAQLGVGQRGRVAYITPPSHTLLERLLALGLSPGAQITVYARAPAFCIDVDGTELALDLEIAATIFVTCCESAPAELTTAG